jgi:hypothetical protein
MVIHKKGHWKIYHNDLKYYMPLNTIFSVVVQLWGYYIAKLELKNKRYQLTHTILNFVLPTHN